MGGAQNNSLRARDVAAYVEALAPPDSGVPRDDNGFTFGDPATEVRGIGVTWMPTAEALREAARLGLNLLVVHEAWWFDAQRSPWYTELPARSKPVNLGRLRLLTDHGLSLYRCHSNWDARPEDGVADRIGPAPDRHRHARSSPTARTYLARRESAGKTRREAVRALKRFLARTIWRHWQECAREDATHPASLTCAAARSQST